MPHAELELMTFLLAVERKHRVIRARAIGVIASRDLIDLDMASIALLSHEEQSNGALYRGLYDFSEAAGISVSKTRVSARSSRKAVIRGLRVMVRSGVIDCGIVGTLVYSQSLAGDNRLMVVDSVDEAYALLGLHSPNFESIP
jgi:hypothetical protein